ncbi:hypothetical protein DIPPA_64817 [Diplonema papillatum]|nr:hypothetical protein DIPPA_64817 [Diplonema papillatum]
MEKPPQMQLAVKRRRNLLFGDSLLCTLEGGDTRILPEDAVQQMRKIAQHESLAGKLNIKTIQLTAANLCADMHFMQVFAEEMHALRQRNIVLESLTLVDACLTDACVKYLLDNVLAPQMLYLSMDRSVVLPSQMNLSGNPGIVLSSLDLIKFAGSSFNGLQYGGSRPPLQLQLVGCSVPLLRDEPSYFSVLTPGQQRCKTATCQSRGGALARGRCGAHIVIDDVARYLEEEVGYQWKLKLGKLGCAEALRILRRVVLSEELGNSPIYVDLSSNDLDVKKLEELVSILKHMKRPRRITALNLAHNKLGGEQNGASGQFLGELATECLLRTIDLSDNLLTAAELETFAAHIQQAKGDHTISMRLRDNLIEVSALPKFETVMCPMNSPCSEESCKQKKGIICHVKDHTVQTRHFEDVVKSFDKQSQVYAFPDPALSIRMLKGKNLSWSRLLQDKAAGNVVCVLTPDVCSALSSMTGREAEAFSERLLPRLTDTGSVVQVRVPEMPSFASRDVFSAVACFRREFPSENIVVVSSPQDPSPVESIVPRITENCLSDLLKSGEAPSFQSCSESKVLSDAVTYLRTLVDSVPLAVQKRIERLCEETSVFLAVPENSSRPASCNLRNPDEALEDFCKQLVSKEQPDDVPWRREEKLFQPREDA